MSEPPTTTKMLPADIDAERATLGALLIDREAIAAIAPWLFAEYFYLEKHAWIYEAILDCYHRRVPPDVRTVSDALRRADRLELIGGLPYMVEVSVATPTAVHVEYYAQIVSRAAMLRRLIQAGSKIAVLGYQEQEDVASLLDQAYLLLEHCRYRGTAAPVHGYTAPQLMAFQAAPTRWIIPGLICAGFGYLAAKPGMGKTWILLAWALAVASGGHVLGTFPVEQGRVLFLALEDTEASLQERLRILLNGAAPPETLICFTEDSGWLPLDAGGLEQIEAHLQQYPDITMVIIDTLTAVAPDLPTMARGNPYRLEYRAYVPVRRLANQHNVAIIGSWHFNKAGMLDPMEMVSGSMGLPAVAVNRLGIVRERSENAATLYSFSKRGREVALALEYDPVTCQWLNRGSATDYQVSEARREILDTLEDEEDGLTPKQISAILQKAYPTTKSLLKKMVGDGQVYTIGKGKYKAKPTTSTEITRITADHAPVIPCAAQQDAANTPWDHGDHGDHAPHRSTHAPTPRDLRDLRDPEPGLAHQNGMALGSRSRSRA